MRRPLRIFLSNGRKIRRGLASRRSTAALAAQINATAQPRPRFLGRTAPGVSRQPLSQSSETPRAPVLVPAETMPGPPGSRVTSPTRRNRTRPTDRLSPVDDPRWARQKSSNNGGDECQERCCCYCDDGRTGTAASSLCPRPLRERAPQSFNKLGRVRGCGPDPSPIFVPETPSGPLPQGARAGPQTPKFMTQQS